MAAENNVGAVKIVGYLEKKGKLKVVTTWKKYWFVLEGRLLLYYRSQEEYENLSPCKGSINMGLATSIRPGLATAGVFQIITRTNTITLRAKERCIQEKWLQALLDASGQQTATNPIKMSHFRYSMDDLIPTGAKTQQQRPALTRQNTLPNGFKNIKIDRSNSIINRIRSIGGQSYGGSLETIIKITKKNKTDHQNSPKKLQEIPREIRRKMNEENKSSLTETDSELDNDEVFQKNDLYSGIVIENTEYISANSRLEAGKSDCDHNKNSLIIENDQYLKSEDVTSTRNGDSSTSETSTSKHEDDGVEYYCIYEDVNNLKTTFSNQNIYHEPNLPPRPPEARKSESDESTGNDNKKMSKFAKFARRFKNNKSPDDIGFKKRSANLILKVMGKKKSDEPIYDTVNYLEIHKVESSAQKENAKHDANLVKTLMDLQQTLEAKKSQIKVLMESSATSLTKMEESEKIVTEERKPEKATNDANTSDPEKINNPPGLPPRRGSKSRSRSKSPFHDVPKNNSPVLPTTEQPFEILTSTQQDYSIDKILNDLEIESRKTDQTNIQAEELSVQQLIKKFNRNSLENEEGCQSIDPDVLMRQKCEHDRITDEAVANLVNRYSDDLNKLLEELTKVTSAPLLTPGVTSSLIQMKSPPMTDEEWLAIAPIRRRRHSEPDYDVPRSHRSLQILPKSPSKLDDNDDNTVIPATRFFGPVLPPSVTEKCLTEQSMSWRSMTPDSLEPLQLLQAAIKKQQQLEMSNHSDLEKDRSVGYEKTSENVSLACMEDKRNECEHMIGRKNVQLDDIKSSDHFLDSLEPFNEGSTAF